MTEFSIRFDKDKAMRQGLREPFPPAQIGKIPASNNRPALDYVGHAAVTDRLNAWAPGTEWTIDREFTHGGAYWVLITMTVGGISRQEYGDGKDPKEALGNAIRRGAMRFGVGVDLWSREELNWQAEDSPTEAAGEGADGGETDADRPTSADSTAGEPASDWGAVGEPGSEGSGSPADPTDDRMSEPGTPEQWARLLALPSVGNSQTKALNRINRANHTSYVKSTVKDATVAELAKALSGD